ncbi:MAG TPA: hypothetical protein VFZ15_01275 [Acidimicrobiia bacterium]|nr:hypothetical protein [Acidimicrobiia bacterium]
MRKAMLSAVVFALLLAGCGSEELTPFALVASSNGSIGVGEQRVMFALVDPETDEFLASPDRDATVNFADENGSPIASYPTEFIWTIPEVRGLYVARLEIPEAGTYQATIDAEGFATAGPVGVVAFEDPPLIQPGEQAPPSETRTSAEYPDLSVISSDPDPDPAMYELSVSDAVTDGTPAVIVFATPAFCVSQTCGPLLDQVKALRTDYAGVDFVHVEIYEDLQVDSPEELTTVAATGEWGLPSEPWVFVVDDTGQVTAAFEGAASDAELRAAIDAVEP